VTDASRMSGQSGDSRPQPRPRPQPDPATDSSGIGAEEPPAERRPRSGLRSLLFGRSDDAGRPAEPDSAAAEADGATPTEGAPDPEPDRFRGLRSVSDDATPAAGTASIGGGLGPRDLDEQSRGDDQQSRGDDQQPSDGFDNSYLADPPDFEFRGFGLPEEKPVERDTTDDSDADGRDFRSDADGRDFGAGQDTHGDSDADRRDFNSDPHGRDFGAGRNDSDADGRDYRRDFGALDSDPHGQDFTAARDSYGARGLRSLAENPVSPAYAGLARGSSHSTGAHSASAHSASAHSASSHSASSHSASRASATPPAGETWWASDAQRDPWRDPDSAPAWMAPPLPPPPPPMLPIRLPTPRGTPRGLGQIVAVALFAAMLAGLLGGALGYVVAARTVGPSVSLGSSASGTPTLARRPPGSVAGIAQRVQPSVVTIDIRSATGAGNGSGFIISKDGYILTNNHVAEPAERGGSLTVVFHDGSTQPARIIGRDPGSDVAVIKVNKNNLPAVQFADSDKVAVGDPVIAFGSPLGLNGTVTTGIVSALERPVKTGGREGGEEAYMAAIQTDAAINPGNSGGPLVDGDGRVIGIDSAIATIPGETGKAGSIGLGFAIPMNMAKRTAEQLIGSGRATTTVIGADLDRNTKLASGGVRVTQVPDGPAKAAGLQPGDVIIRLNNRVIGDAVDLIALIRKLTPGTKATVVYLRGGRPNTTTITLGGKTVN